MAWFADKTAQEGRAMAQGKCSHVRWFEMDGTGVGKHYVSPTSTKWKAHIETWKKTRGNGKKPAYYQVFVRLLGLLHRSSGILLLFPLVQRLSPAKARPPTESKEEVVRSGLVERIPRNAGLATDGCKAYPAVLKVFRKTQIALKQVSHQKYEFSRKLKPMKARGMKIAGTQALDATWKYVKRFRPTSLKMKNPETGKANPALYTWAFAYAWRKNMRACNLPLGAELSKVLWN